MMGFKPLKPGFSPAGRRQIRSYVWINMTCSFLILLMVNYMATRIHFRAHTADDTSQSLSPLTTAILKAIDSEMEIVLYFDPDHGVFKALQSLTREYALANANIRLRHIDYLSDPAGAALVRDQYKLVFSGEKDVVLINYKNSSRAIMEADLSVLDIDELLAGTSREIRRSAFKGEQVLTSAILSLTLSEEKKVYFTEGHNEADMDDAIEQGGFSRFSQSLARNHCSTFPLNLSGTNSIPSDASLLVIAGPQSGFSPRELRVLDDYLESGGNIMACLNSRTKTGLEPLLAKYGIGLADNVILDRAHSPSGNATDMTVTNFNAHPLTRPVYNGQLYFFLPRSVHSMEKHMPPDENLRIEELVYTSPEAQEVTRYSNGELNPTLNDRVGEFPLAVFSTKSIQKDQQVRVAKLLVIGESLFLGNTGIQNFMNYEFGLHCANFLMERNLFTDNIAPKPITEYKLNLTAGQRTLSRWLLLAVFPGFFLALGIGIHLIRAPKS